MFSDPTGIFAQKTHIEQFFFGFFKNDVARGAVWQLNWGQGPWTWSTIAGEPLLDSNVSAVLDLRTTAAADVNSQSCCSEPKRSSRYPAHIIAVRRNSDCIRVIGASYYALVEDESS